MLGTLLYIIIIIIAIIVIVALLRFVFQLFLIGPAGIETTDHEIFNRLIFSLELSHQEATIWDTQYQIMKREYFSVSEVPLLMQHRIVKLTIVTEGFFHETGIVLLLIQTTMSILITNHSRYLQGQYII